MVFNVILIMALIALAIYAIGQRSMRQDADKALVSARERLKEASNEAAVSAEEQLHINDSADHEIADLRRQIAADHEESAGLHAQIATAAARIEELSKQRAQRFRGKK